MSQLKPAPTESDRAITRLCWSVAFLLLVTHFVLAWLVHTPAITTGNDDALYLLLARSVRAFHYLDSHLVGAPIHAQYPLGFPAFLAIFGGHFDAAILGNILVSTLGLLLAYDLGRRVLGPVPAVLALAVLAVNPALIGYAGSIRSESLFMTATVAAIWCAWRTPLTAWWLFAAGACSIYAAMVRTIGVALVAALLLIWLMERRYRAAAIFAGLAMFIVGGWLTLTALVPDQFYARSYAAAMGRAESAPTAIGVLINRVEATFSYLYGNIPAALSVPTLGGTVVDNAIWALVISVGLLAGLVAWWRRAPLVTAFLIFYAAILTLYPFKLTRFVVPILPLLLLTIVSGWALIVSRFSARSMLGATILLSVPLLGAGTWRAFDMVQAAARCQADDPWGPTPCSRPVQRAFFAAAAYARTETPPNASFVTLKEATFALLTGRKVQHPERLIRRDSLDIVGQMRAEGLNHLLLTPIHPSRLSRLLVRQCTELKVVQRFSPETSILRLRSPADSAGDNACAVLLNSSMNGEGQGEA